MKNKFIFLLIFFIIYNYIINAQTVIDPDRFIYATTIDPKTNLLGLKNVDPNFPDCNVPEEYNEVIIINKKGKRKLIGRINSDWFKIEMPYKRGDKIPYSNHIDNGNFALKLNNKYAIYSVIDQKITYENLDSIYKVYPMWTDASWPLLGIEKNNILYTLNKKDSLQFHVKNIQFTQAINDKGQIRYGLKLLKLNNDSVQLLPSTFEYLNYAGSYFNLKGKREDSIFYFGRNLNTPLINVGEETGFNNSYTTLDKNVLHFDDDFDLLFCDTTKFIDKYFRSQNLYCKTKDTSFVYYNSLGKEIFKHSLVNISTINGPPWHLNDTILIQYFEDMKTKKYSTFIFNTNTSKVINGLDYQVLYDVNKKNLIAKKNNKYGVLDLNENIIVPFIYDSISWYLGNRISYYNYLNGKYIIKQNGKYGLMNSKFEVIIKPEYDRVNQISKDVHSPPLIIFKHNKKNVVYNYVTLEKKKFMCDSINYKPATGPNPTYLYYKGKIKKLDNDGNLVK